MPEPEQIRTAELNADHLGRTVRIDPGDQTSVMGRLTEVRHKQVGAEDSPGVETRLELRVLGAQRVAVGFSALGVVELL